MDEAMDVAEADAQERLEALLDGGVERADGAILEAGKPDRGDRSHLYVYDFQTGNRRQLTSGKYEIQSLILSNDRKHFYFSANIDHPGITHFYKISVSGGEPTQLTNMKGGNEVSLSPDEKWLAIRHSTSNRPIPTSTSTNSTSRRVTCG